MDNITYEEYKKALIIAYKYLKETRANYIDEQDLWRYNAEINLLTALCHPYLYLEDEVKK